MTDTIVRYCEVEGCKRKYVAKGLCDTHYRRQRKTGSTDATKDFHGKQGTPEYISWYGLKSRCSNAKQHSYKDYGGRGIEVCPEWQKSFSKFLADMGPKPTPKHTIDRIDNGKGYSKDNCKWSTRKEQLANQRIRKDNKTGVKGVHWHKDTGKYAAVISKNGKRKHIGIYEKLEEAVQARQEAEIQYYQQVKVN